VSMTENPKVDEQASIDLFASTMLPRSIVRSVEAAGHL